MISISSPIPWQEDLPSQLSLGGISSPSQGSLPEHLSKCDCCANIHDHDYNGDGADGDNCDGVDDDDDDGVDDLHRGLWLLGN